MIQLTAKQVESELTKVANPKKVADFLRFFKTAKGAYAEGDFFIGVSLPKQRAIASSYKNLPITEVDNLLKSKIHEYRSTALIILTLQASKAKTISKLQPIVDCYCVNIDAVNNWDLVDLSCHKILGPWIDLTKSNILEEYAQTNNLWKQRISIVTTYWFIKQGDFDQCLKIALILLPERQDLIQKAVGWMLKEIGKRDVKTLLNFLDQHYTKMPRTSLRTAIEKLDEPIRLAYLKGIRNK